MGIFDLFKKEDDKSGKTGSEKLVTASEEEMHNHVRKSNFYRFAFFYLPGHLFKDPAQCIKDMKEKGDTYLHHHFHNYMEKAGDPIKNPSSYQYKFIHFPFPEMQHEICCINYSGADAPTGNLEHVPGPHHSAIIYNCASPHVPEYFVLCNAAGGKTNLRQVTSGGLNIHCMEGPTGKFTSHDFVDFLKINLLNKRNQ